MSFRRPAGWVLDYFIEASQEMQAWTQEAAEVIVARSPHRLFDGTGTKEVFYSLGKATSVRPNGFLRVRAVPKQQQ